VVTSFIEGRDLISQYGFRCTSHVVWYLVAVGLIVWHHTGKLSSLKFISEGHQNYVYTMAWYPAAVALCGTS